MTGKPDIIRQGKGWPTTRTLSIALSIRLVVSESPTRQVTGRFWDCECNGDFSPTTLRNTANRRGERGERGTKMRVYTYEWEGEFLECDRDQEGS